MSKNKHNVSSSHDTRPTIAYLTAVPGDNEEFLPLKERVLWRYGSGQKPKTC